MKHILKLAAIGLVAAIAFFVISFLVRIVVGVLAIGIIARIIFSLGKYGKPGMQDGHRFFSRGNFGMQDAGAVSIDGDMYRAAMKQSSREQKITVF